MWRIGRAGAPNNGHIGLGVVVYKMWWCMANTVVAYQRNGACACLTQIFLWVCFSVYFLLIMSRSWGEIMADHYVTKYLIFQCIHFRIEVWSKIRWQGIKTQNQTLFICVKILTNHYSTFNNFQFLIDIPANFDIITTIIFTISVRSSYYA